ncbi:MAG: PleD family two-component system response regulator [Alphaproteobacteria bacterium]
MSGRILVVDDNPLNVKLLAARLAREYYAVTTANNGAEALSAACAANAPDLILLDVMMPDIDGFETCRRLRADSRTRHIPVVMVTALSDIEDRIKGLEAGAQDFLSKPIQDTALLARVRSLLRLKMVMDEWRMRDTTGNSMGVTAARLNEEIDVSKPNILLVCDDALEGSQMTAALGKTGAHVTLVSTPETAKSAAVNGTFDLTICSLALRQDDGLKICPALRGQENTRYLPILLLGDQGDLDRVARGLDLGANDYLLRPLDEIELTARVLNQVRFRRSYERLKQNYEDSLTMALTDSLTGAFNRRYFDNHLPRLMRRCLDTNKSLSLLVVDVDNFKKVNDQFGHDSGDLVLKEIALRLLNNLRPSDFVARYGGEEFVVVLPETGSDLAGIIANRLLETVGKTPLKLLSPHQPQTITISVGGAVMTPADTPNDLFKRADQATYAAKQAGRNRFIIAQ